MLINKSGGEGDTKTQYRGGIAEKEGAWTVCRFKGRMGAWQEKWGGIFEGELIPQYILWKCWNSRLVLLFLDKPCLLHQQTELYN